jgi:hypothetical protein
MRLFLGFAAGFFLCAFIVILRFLDSPIRWHSKFDLKPSVVYSKIGAFTSEVIYDYSGGLSHLQFMFNGEPSGPSISFHANGEIAEIGQYINGKKTGNWNTYMPDGSEGYNAIFLGGNVVSGRWYTPP